MKILIDHCIDWRLGRSLPEHECKSAKELGWDELKNGKLLAAAPKYFGVMITVDQNLKSEQNLKALPITVIVLIAHSNRLDLWQESSLGWPTSVTAGVIGEIRLTNRRRCGRRS